MERRRKQGPDTPAPSAVSSRLSERPQVARRPHRIIRLLARRSGCAPRRAAEDVGGATAGERAGRRRDEGRCEGTTASPLHRNRRHPVGH